MVKNYMQIMGSAANSTNLVAPFSLDPVSLWYYPTNVPRIAPYADVCILETNSIIRIQVHEPLSEHVDLLKNLSSIERKSQLLNKPLFMLLYSTNMLYMRIS